MAVFTKTSVPARAHTLPREYYTAEDIFRREGELIFSRRWLCVGREEQLPAAGSYFLAEAAGESIIVVRGGDGAVRAFYNVCRHRGTRISTEAEGCFGERIQCPYHGWSYGFDGRLLGAPHMEADFRHADYPLHAVHAAIWDGHIFLHCGDNPQRVEYQLGSLPAKFAS